MKYNVLQIRDIFNNEFLEIGKKFNIIELKIRDALENGNNDVNQPGVYVYWHPAHGVIKVGKSQSNSKKRALEHISDNTKNLKISISEIAKDQQTMLLLFNIIDSKDLHWTLSLEAFMEWNIEPIIKSARMG